MSKRLIEAEDAKMRILNLWTRDKTLEEAVEDGYQYAIALVDAIDAVDDSPTVEVVRCKHCRKWLNGDDINGTCNWNEYQTLQTRYDDYCSQGERK